MGWQVLQLNKLDLSKQQKDSSLSAAASAELREIRNNLGKFIDFSLRDEREMLIHENAKGYFISSSHEQLISFTHCEQNKK